MGKFLIYVSRQRQLEDALLFHGLFHDAVQALIYWLNSVEPALSTETAVMGDVETVKLLIDQHKVRLSLFVTLLSLSDVPLLIVSDEKVQ